MKKLPLLLVSVLFFTGTVSALEIKSDEKTPEIKSIEAEVKAYTDSNADVPVVHVYTPEEINAWVMQGNDLYNLSEVNGCQFSDDIKLRAKKDVAASYQYLYSHMLLSGTCAPKDVAQGIFYLEKAADKAYPAALRKLGFFYEIGRYVGQDQVKAEALMREAAEIGFVPARIDWAGMLLRNMGETRDLPEAYSLLKHSVPSTPWESEYTKRYIAEIESLIPENVRVEALRASWY